MNNAQKFTPPCPLHTAVLFLIYKRPDTTRQVFEAIRKAKPPRLYVAADGPKLDVPGEAERVQQAREIVMSGVDWDCEVKTLFRDKNFGCKYGVSGGIAWFFEHEEEGIILEDDTLPSQSFFWFCQELLERYRDDERVWVITGDNFQGGIKRGEGSYYFSKYNHCWGWATWRHAWQHYQGELPFWSKWKFSADWRYKIPDAVERRYWKHIFDRVRAGKIDSWGYPWTASVWHYGGLTATPNVNLVSNIGFGLDSTHTTSTKSPHAAMTTGPIGEVVHPHNVVQDTVADRYVFDHTFGGRNLRFPRILYYFPRRIAGGIYRILKKVFS